MRCFGGFRSSRRYHPNQELEILNFRVVPDLQISKKVEFLMIYMFFFYFLSFIKPNPRGAAILERTPSIRGGLGLPMEMCGHSDGRKGNPRGGVRGSRVRPYVTPLQKEENGSLGGWVPGRGESKPPDFA